MKIDSNLDKTVSFASYVTSALLDEYVAIDLKKRLESVNKVVESKNLIDVPVKQLPNEIQLELMSILQASNELETRGKAREAYRNVALKPRKHRVIEKLENGGYVK